MGRSFRIDLGNGRHPTVAGGIVIVLAAFVTVGAIFVGPAAGLLQVFAWLGLLRLEHFFGMWFWALVVLSAVLCGIATFGCGWLVCKLFGIPFSKPGDSGGGSGQ
jgi:hypothetical protein